MCIRDSTKHKPKYLLRGVQDNFAKSIDEEASATGKKYVEEFLLTPYSIDEDVAKFFARKGKKFGIVYKREFDSQEVVMIPSLFTLDYIHEKEIVISGRVIEIAKFNIVWKKLS